MAPLSVVVITASNRAAAGIYPDRSGPLLSEALSTAGHTPHGPRVVPDGPPLGEALRTALAERHDVALTTGGTGLTPTDATPEATREVLSYEIPGIAEALRSVGRERGVATAVLSRGLAGVAESGGHRMLVVNLPGSSGGVRDGIGLLLEVMPHAVQQMRGGDHPRRSS